MKHPGFRFLSAWLALSGCIAAAPDEAGAANPGNVAQQALPVIPLASYNGGPAMFERAMSQLRADVAVKFLDKDYENDVYAREPITNKKVRVSCVRLRADSGFHFSMNPPTYNLTSQQLTITGNIARIRADGLAVKVMLGPCAWTGAGLGVQLTDVKLVYKARPMLAFDAAGTCRLAWNNDPNGIAISIGDLNIIGVQNDLDKLAKDAVREAINFSLDAVFGGALRGELQKVVLDTCGAKRR
jgi:hypothetical protein